MHSKSSCKHWELAVPELPEVETVRRGLQRLIVGKVVKGVRVLNSPKSFPNSSKDTQAFVVGASVRVVRRRAKVLLVELSSEYTLVVHLKMTGQLVYVGQAGSDISRHVRSRQAENASLALQSAELVSLKQSSTGQETDTFSSGFAQNDEKMSATSSLAAKEERFGAGHPNDSLIGELPDKSTRLELTFSDGSHLYFNDQRKFGWMKLYPTLEVPNIDFMQKVGPEPLEASFTPKDFIQCIRRRNGTTIKAAILDQTVLAGVGNIYADESLWGAQLHPATRVRDVSDAQLATLLHEIKYVMNLAIEKGGSTDKNYVNAEGKRGSYIDFARVFRREGQACPRHPKVIIEKTRVAGRGTHICPLCQAT